MAATTQEINDFKATIMAKQSEIGNSLVTLLSINGRSENGQFLTKFRGINSYTNILIDYFSEPDYTNNNFFTVDEIYEIIEHFNDLCNSDYTITL
jgi:hypothetical protein